MTKTPGIIVRGSFTHERQRKTNAFVDGEAQRLNRNLDIVRANASFLPSVRHGFTLGVNTSSGTVDSLVYAADPVSGSRMGIPNTTSFTGEYVFNAWQNVRIGAQFQMFSKFNGASRNYDGSGRRASDNNTLYLFSWLAFSSRARHGHQFSVLMAVAALYDIHGNLPALDAVLADIERSDVSALVVGGDVLPGPLAAEVLRRLRALSIPVHWIRGNGDREALAHRAGGGSETLPPAVRESLRWCGLQLTEEECVLVGTWPLSRRMTVDGRDVLFCHATPRSDTEIFLADTPELPLIPIIANAGTPLVVCGHTHIPFDRRVGDVRVVNAGSIGMPFGAPGAHWLMVGADVEPRLTMYDLERAARIVRRSDYPGRDFADRYILTTPDAATATAAMRPGEIR